MMLCCTPIVVDSYLVIHSYESSSTRKVSMVFNLYVPVRCEHAYWILRLFQHQHANLSLCITGHGGSDGLHGYVPSLDYVIEDMVSLYLFTYFYIMFKVFQ